MLAIIFIKCYGKLLTFLYYNTVLMVHGCTACHVGIKKTKSKRHSHKNHEDGKDHTFHGTHTFYTPWATFSAVLLNSVCKIWGGKGIWFKGNSMDPGFYPGSAVWPWTICNLCALIYSFEKWRYWNNAIYFTSEGCSLNHSQCFQSTFLDPQVKGDV